MAPIDFRYLFCLLWVFSRVGWAAPPPVVFNEETLVIGGQKIQVEIASTPEEKARGLMFRTSLKEGRGMLFVFEREETLSFWMKNTFVPLSIGFFDSRQALVDMQDMDPVKSVMEKKVPQYQSRRPAQFALEVPRGWFERNKISLGVKFKLDGANRPSRRKSGPTPQ